MRSGAWGQVAEVTGIECAGTVEHDATGQLPAGTTVIAILGGMGRTRNGSYAELVTVPASNVVPMRTTLSWTDLVAIPETYATAWTTLHDNLAVDAGSRSSSAVPRLRWARPSSTSPSTRRDRHRDDPRPGAGATPYRPRSRPGAHRRRCDRRTSTGRLDARRRARRHRGQLHAARLAAPCAATRTRLPDRLPRRTRSRDRLRPAGGPAHRRPVDLLRQCVRPGHARLPARRRTVRRHRGQGRRGRLHARPVRVFDFDDIITAHKTMEAGTAGGKMVVSVPD